MKVTLPSFDCSHSSAVVMSNSLPSPRPNAIVSQEDFEMKHRVFIASSTESLDIAYAVQSELDPWTEPEVWKQGIFMPSSTVLDDLVRTSNEFEFGVFVFSPDDILKIRDQEFLTPRDNVMFELGVFIGKLGKERTFIITPRNEKHFHLPTDLLGLITVSFDASRTNLQAALGPAITQIRRAMDKISEAAVRAKDRQETSQQVIRRIVELHQPDFSDVTINDWRVTYSIDETGNSDQYEELTLIPAEHPLYFYLVDSNLAIEGGIPQMLARNAEAGTPLSLLELDRSETLTNYAVILDPPATKENPQRIIMDIKRPALWKNLVEKGEDQGLFRSANKSNSLRLEFVAPTGRKWKGFSPVSRNGDVNMSPSRITWVIQDTDQRRYSYKLFLE